MALALAAGACSVFSPSDPGSRLDVKETEVQVWNDSMPGSRPRCNVTLGLMVKNTSGDTVRLRDPEVRILDAVSGEPVRRFPPSLLAETIPAKRIALAPRDSIALLFRSPSWGVDPINREQHPSVRISIRMLSDSEQPWLFTSTPTLIFATQ